jgi:hypothetical protein
MKNFSLAAIIVLALSDEVLASIEKTDLDTLIGAMSEMPQTPHVSAALERLLDRMADDAPRYSEETTFLH